jgi:hypothetical protein
MSARVFSASLIGLLALEIVSLFAFRWSVAAWAVLLGLMPTLFVLGYRAPKAGLFVVLAELVTGGKGYLLFGEIGGIRISLRLVLFVSFLAGFAARALTDRIRTPHLKAYRWPLAVFGTAFVVAVAVGLGSGHGIGEVFLDANAYLYLALWPAFTVFSRADRAGIVSVLLAGAVVTAVKSYVTLTLFVHGSARILPFAYHWIRDTGVGEISPIVGSLVRVFFQSHAYSLLAAVLALGLLVPVLRRKRPEYLPGALLVGLASGGAAVSLSRSLWLGAAVGLVVLVVASGTLLRAVPLLRYVGVLTGVLLLNLFFTSWAIHFPYPLSGSGQGSGGLVAARVSDLSGEPAASSRLEQLRPLSAAILRSPVWGSGFAQTVTYTSDDPRVRQRALDGRFTTYSFEWGYLDQFLKFGLLGTVPFILLWFILLVRLFRRRRDALCLGALAATTALLATHMTSPYLNHPLGLGWLMIADAFTRDV